MWAWYSEFLLQQGAEEKQAEVVANCVVCEPKYGEVWQAVAKELANAYLEPEQVLKLVVAKLS